jgi:hemin uptake protein HemP
MMDTPPAPSASPPATGAAAPAERRITSRDLFGDAREIVIEHAGRVYRMRITQNDKLILTA